MRYYKVRTLENITLERLRGTGRDYPAARECAADCRVCQMHWVCRVRQLPQHLCVRCAINCKAAASQITRLATQLTHPLSLIPPPPPKLATHSRALAMSGACLRAAAGTKGTENLSRKWKSADNNAHAAPRRRQSQLSSSHHHQQRHRPLQQQQRQPGEAAWRSSQSMWQPPSHCSSARLLEILK